MDEPFPPPKKMAGIAAPNSAPVSHQAASLWPWSSPWICSQGMSWESPARAWGPMRSSGTPWRWAPGALISPKAENNCGGLPGYRGLAPKKMMQKNGENDDDDDDDDDDLWWLMMIHKRLMTLIASTLRSTFWGYPILRQPQWCDAQWSLVLF